MSVCVCVTRQLNALNLFTNTWNSVGCAVKEKHVNEPKKQLLLISLIH